MRAFEIAREAGLGITVHAGEFGGWESVAAALDHIKPVPHRPWRAGHRGPGPGRRIADEEWCWNAARSRMSRWVFPGFDTHPFPALLAAGCKVTLNSDDPPYFRTSSSANTLIAAKHFGYG